MQSLDYYKDASALDAGLQFIAQLYKNVVYYVCDVESDGANVLKNGMIAVSGAVIQVFPKKILARFVYHVIPPQGTAKDPRTWYEFWSKNRATWDKLHKDQVPARVATQGIVRVANHFKDKEMMFASDCSPYDMKWVDVYVREDFPVNPLGYAALDIYSYAAGMLKVPRHMVTDVIRKLAQEGMILQDTTTHDHDPFNDALQEACLLVDLIYMNHGVKPPPLINNLTKRPQNSYEFDS